MEEHSGGAWQVRRFGALQQEALVAQPCRSASDEPLREVLQSEQALEVLSTLLALHLPVGLSSRPAATGRVLPPAQTNGRTQETLISVCWLTLCLTLFLYLWCFLLVGLFVFVCLCMHGECMCVCMHMECVFVCMHVDCRCVCMRVECMCMSFLCVLFVFTPVLITVPLYCCSKVLRDCFFISAFTTRTLFPNHSTNL